MPGSPATKMVVNRRDGSTTLTEKDGLSSRNLERQDALVRRGKGRHAEHLISQEQNQLWREEMYHRRKESDFESPLDEVQPGSVGTAYHSDPWEGIRTYRSPPLSPESPLERFATLSAANDPHPWMAKAEMEENGIEYGSMDSAEARRYAAEQSIAHVEGEGSGKLVSSSPTLESPARHVKLVREERRKKLSRVMKVPKLRKPAMAGKARESPSKSSGAE